MNYFYSFFRIKCACNVCVCVMCVYISVWWCVCVSMWVCVSGRNLISSPLSFYATILGGQIYIATNNKREIKTKCLLLLLLNARTVDIGILQSISLILFIEKNYIFTKTRWNDQSRCSFERFVCNFNFNFKLPQKSLQIFLWICKQRFIATTHRLKLNQTKSFSAKFRRL